MTVSICVKLTINTKKISNITEKETKKMLVIIYLCSACRTLLLIPSLELIAAPAAPPLSSTIDPRKAKRRNADPRYLTTAHPGLLSDPSNIVIVEYSVRRGGKGRGVDKALFEKVMKSIGESK